MAFSARRRIIKRRKSPKWGRVRQGNLRRGSAVKSRNSAHVTTRPSFVLCVVLSLDEIVRGETRRRRINRAVSNDHTSVIILLDMEFVLLPTQKSNDSTFLCSAGFNKLRN